MILYYIYLYIYILSDQFKSRKMWRSCLKKIKMYLILHFSASKIWYCSFWRFEHMFYVLEFTPNGNFICQLQHLKTHMARWVGEWYMICMCSCPQEYWDVYSAQWNETINLRLKRKRKVCFLKVLFSGGHHPS